MPLTDLLRRPPDPPDAAKEIIVARFIAGEPMADVAAFYGLHRLHVEQILRDGFEQMLRQTAAGAES